MPNATRIAHRCRPVGYDRFQAEFTTAFCAYVGTYGGECKFITIADLAIVTCKQPRTIEAWRDGETVPRGADLFALMAVLPAGFTNRMLGLIGLGGAQEMAGQNLSLHLLAAEAAAFLAQHTDHMVDGVIDHRERLRENQTLRNVRDQIDAYLAGQAAGGAA